MKSLILLSVGLTFAMGGKCPDEESIRPHCWCLDSFHGGALFCEDFSNPTELVAPIEACKGHNVTALGIFNSTLLYLPHDLFVGTTFAKISLIDTVLMSLSNSPLAFEGLENHLKELRASQTQYVTQWQFKQLRQLHEMEVIDINWIHMETIDEDLPNFPNLQALGLVHAGISYISDKAFAECPNLWVLDLRHNFLSELKRSMLPNPALKLGILNLEGNELSQLPSDFFQGMPQLTDVFLSKNQFATISDDTFRSVFAQLHTLDFRGNALRCDCRMLWLVTNRQPRNLEAICDQPQSLRGTQVRYLTSKSIRC